MKIKIFLPIFGKYANTWVQKGQQTLPRLNATKSILKYDITKFSKVKEKENRDTEEKRCLGVFQLPNSMFYR